MGTLSQAFSHLTPVSPGMAMVDVYTASRMNAIQDAIKALIRGENLTAGPNVRLKRQGATNVICADSSTSTTDLSDLEYAVFGVDGFADTDGLYAEMYGTDAWEGDPSGNIDLTSPLTEGVLFMLYGADGLADDLGIIAEIYGTDGDGVITGDSNSSGLLYSIYGENGAADTNGLLADMYGLDAAGDINGPSDDGTFDDGMIYSVYGTDGGADDVGLLAEVYGRDNVGNVTASAFTEGLIWEVFGTNGAADTDGLDFDMYSTDPTAAVQSLDDRITALESFVDSFSPVQVIGTDGYEFEFYVPDTVDYPYVGTPAYWTEVTIGSDSGIMQIV